MSKKKTIRITSDNVDSAICRALSLLKLPKEELEIVVVQEESTGLFGKKKAIVEFSFDPEEQKLREEESELEEFIDLKIIDKGIYLKVHPLPEKLKQKASHLVNRYIKRRNILEMDRELLKKIVDMQNGKYLLIQKTDVCKIGDAAISIFRTDDMMKASLIRFDLNSLDVGGLLDQLEKLGIKYGIKKEVIQNLNDKRLLNKSVIIAEGTMPVREIRAPLKYNFDPDIFSVSFDENNKVDFRNLSRLAFVKKGQILVEKEKMIPGQNGKRIDGVEVPFDVEYDNPIPHGRGVVAGDGGRSLISNIDGHLGFDCGIVSVEPVYMVKENVDYHTGNIEFDGSVVVCGDILAGFKVKATGKVEVGGVIDGGIVETEGNLVAKQGIFSKGVGYITVGGTLSAKHIEGMKIKATRVRVYSAIINADVDADEYVEVFGEPGTIIGGCIKAGYYIKANTIGSPIANKTSITVGNSNKLVEEFAQTSESIKALKDKSNKMQVILSSCGNSADVPVQNAAAIDTFSKLKALDSETSCELAEMDSKMKSLEENEKRCRLAKVHFRDNIYEGVTVRIFTGQLAINKTTKHGSIVFEDEEVKIIHYHYME